MELTTIRIKTVETAVNPIQFLGAPIVTRWREMVVKDGSENTLYCEKCGSAFALTAAFCVVCGVSRDEALGTAPKLYDEQGETNLTQPEPRQRFKGVRKVLSLRRVLAFVVVFSLLAGGIYFLTRPKWDFEGKTMLEAFKGDTEAMNRAFDLSCNSLENVNEANISDLRALSSTIDYDYREAMNLDSDALNATYENDLDDWADEYTRSTFGDSAADFQYFNNLVSDFKTRAASYCSSQINPSRVTVTNEIQTVSNQIDNIQYPPYDWEGVSYFTNDADENIAWRWAKSWESYSCPSYSDGCITLIVKTRFKCRGSLRVEFGLHYTQSGTTPWDTVTAYDNSPPAAKSQVKIQGINWSGDYYGWWSVESLECI